jgi:hypothetical protein
MREAAEKSYGAALLRALPPGDARGMTAVYVPEASMFWEWPEVCDGYAGARARTQGFFFQGVAGFPVLNGWPYDRKPCGQRDSEFIFGQEKLSPPEGEPDAWLCEEAQRRGFDTVLILQDGAQPDYRRLACGL